MSKSVFSDSNVVIYAFTRAGEKTERAREMPSIGGIVSVQVLNETANTLSRRFVVGWPRIREIIDDVLNWCPNARPIGLETHRSGLRLSERYGYSAYDGIILASALESDCKKLYSEDMQHGQIIEGLRIENPFL